MKAPCLASIAMIMILNFGWSTWTAVAADSEGTSSFGATLVPDGAALKAASAAVGSIAPPKVENKKQNSPVSSRSRFETTLTPACPSNDPNTVNTNDMACQYLLMACSFAGRGDGIMTWIWTRPLSASGKPSGSWVRMGDSCDVPAAAVAAAAARPVLTVGMVRQAFRQVDFALPAVHVQPEGNVTLVNLPTYFEVRWPAQGVQPREIATVQLLGRSVRIRPLGKSFVYRFGDGELLGPTSDAGGPYPEGRIRHTYTRPAKAVVSVVATYGAEFSVDEGPWQGVGETVTIDGPAQGVQVREARARLEAD